MIILNNKNIIEYTTFLHNKQKRGYNNINVISVAKNHNGAEGWFSKIKKDVRKSHKEKSTDVFTY
jgi:hypothetical protein